VVDEPSPHPAPVAQAHDVALHAKQSAGPDLLP